MTNEYNNIEEKVLRECTAYDIFLICLDQIAAYHGKERTSLGYSDYALKYDSPSISAICEDEKLKLFGFTRTSSRGSSGKNDTNEQIFIEALDEEKLRMTIKEKTNYNEGTAEVTYDKAYNAIIKLEGTEIVSEISGHSFFENTEKTSSDKYYDLKEIRTKAPKGLKSLIDLSQNKVYAKQVVKKRKIR